MHQASARVWNQIAEQQPLATAWAKQMFPLPSDLLDAALEKEESRLARETNDPVVASAYLKVMPLLWERTAISNFLQDNPSLSPALTPMADTSEAVMIASKDFQLTVSQKKKLRRLLDVRPT